MDLEGDIDPIDKLFSRKHEIHVYRMIQGGLNNVIRHADAATVRLRVERKDDEVVICLADDGRGFLMNPKDMRLKESHGLGMTDLAERTKILGGRFKCDTAPGEGTRLTFNLPCSKKDEKED